MPFVDGSVALFSPAPSQWVAAQAKCTDKMSCFPQSHLPRERPVNPSPLLLPWRGPFRLRSARHCSRMVSRTSICLTMKARFAVRPWAQEVSNSPCLILFLLRNKATALAKAPSKRASMLSSCGFGTTGVEGSVPSRYLSFVALPDSVPLVCQNKKKGKGEKGKGKKKGRRREEEGKKKGRRGKGKQRKKEEKKRNREKEMLMCINVMTPFSLRDSNQRTACARSVRLSQHVCCQVYMVQVSVSNIVADATGSRVHTTSIHKYPPSVSCHVPRCSIPSQHISPMMRSNELPQNPISINTPLGDDDCNVFRLSGMSSYR